MHIVYVNQNDFSYLGGVELHILNLGCELRKQGDKVTLLCREQREDCGWSPPSDGIRIVRASGLREIFSFFWKEAEHIDVCHAHMSRKPFALFGLLMAGRFNIPTVFTPHCFYPSPDVKTRLAKRLYDTTLTRLTFSSSDRVINLTPRDQQDSLERGMLPRKSRVIPNSIHFSHLQNAPLVPFREKYGIHGAFLLHVGRFAKQKHIEFLVRNHVHFETENLSLVLIGQDDGEMQRIARLVEDAGLSDRVRLIERIDYDELCAAYREASVLVMASRNEGLPTVIMEAAIFGTPVIAPNVGGIPFIVEEGVNGYLYEWGDSQSYMKLVRRIIAGRLRVNETSRARLVERFSWEVNAGKVRSLYEEIIREKRQGLNRTGAKAVRLNQAGLIFGESAPAGGTNVQKRLRHLARLCQLGGESAVDLGCGKGAYLAEISRWYERVVGVDILPENLLLAKRRLFAGGLQRNTLVCASAENLCLPDKCCDAVFLIEVLDHVPSVPTCLGEAFRILRPGGVCYISVPNRLFPLETHPVRLLGKCFPPTWFPLLPWIKPLHARMATARVFSKREVERLANLSGFDVVGISAMYPPLEHRGSPKSRRLMTWLENTRLQGFGSTLLAVVRKPGTYLARASVRPVAQARGPVDSL